MSEPYQCVGKHSWDFVDLDSNFPGIVTINGNMSKVVYLSVSFDELRKGQAH